MRLAVTSILFICCALPTFLHASIQLKIADSAAIHAALGKPPDSLWYCKEAYAAIKDGTVPLFDPDSTYWVDSINFPQTLCIWIIGFTV